MSLSLLAAADLAQTAAAFTHWRSITPVGARIPMDRWAQAVALAARHGVSKVAATLRLDYAGLKRRLMPPVPVPSTTSPAFVEMILDLPPSGPGCVLTLSDARGRSLRIDVDQDGEQRGHGGGAQPVGSGAMLALTPQLRVLVATAPADFR